MIESTQCPDKDSKTNFLIFIFPSRCFYVPKNNVKCRLIDEVGYKTEQMKPGD